MVLAIHQDRRTDERLNASPRMCATENVLPRTCYRERATEAYSRRPLSRRTHESTDRAALWRKTFCEDGLGAPSADAVCAA
jgi:hypothetical protein